METIKDVLCFLSEFDFVDKLEYNYPERLNEIKRIIVKEYENYNTSKMIEALNIIDEIKLSDVADDLDYKLERTDSLRNIIFYLVDFKRLTDLVNKPRDYDCKVEE